MGETTNLTRPSGYRPYRFVESFQQQGKGAIRKSARKVWRSGALVSDASDERERTTCSGENVPLSHEIASWNQQAPSFTTSITCRQGISFLSAQLRPDNRRGARVSVKKSMMGVPPMNAGRHRYDKLFDEDIVVVVVEDSGRSPMIIGLRDQNGPFACCAERRADLENMRSLLANPTR